MLAETPTPGPGESASPKTIPWTQLGAAAGAQYSGDGLTVSQTEQGARLSCVFQRLEGEATREGLWLTSTAPGQPNDRFRVIAVELVREGRAGSPLPADGAHGVTRPTRLPATGEVSVDGQTVRFTRPGLVEEYTVSMDGVRHDFVVLEKPPLTPSLSPSDGERVADRPGEGELRLELAVTGAKVEPTASGAQLVLEKSGRKIAYGRLRVTDATGKELTARMDIASSRQSAAEMEQDGGGLPTRRYARLAVIVDDAQAVYPIRIDPTFSDANWVSMGNLPGADGNVYAAVVDGSGNLYIGGVFTAVGDVVANRIAKWNGSGWSALGQGMNEDVYALAVSGNDLFAGGRFTTAGGVSASYISKWNGSDWSALGAGMNDDVLAVAVSGSDLYVGGFFTTAGGNPASRIAKWNGSTWSPLGSGMNEDVYALAVSGNDLYAGGTFTTAGGISATNIAKWDGSDWSALGSGVNDRVYALAVSGSDLYAGGFFTTANGLPANYVAKWDGGSWSALGSAMNSAVLALAVSGSDLYAGGFFNTAGGNPANRIAKWNGGSWSALGSGMNDEGVNALAVFGGGVYPGGSFTTAGANPANQIAKWNGSDWSALGSGSGMNSSVSALTVSGSDVYVGGWFTTAGGASANYIAKWNGSSWSTLGSGMNNGINALAVSGSDVYAGGYFATAGGVSVNRVAKWNGSSWSALGSGMNDSVHALAVSGSDVYAGGRFTSATNSGGVSVSVNRIAKWNGTSWNALGLGITGGFAPSVYVLEVSGSDVYAGGWFTTASGVSANNIAKWNGIWRPLGSGMNNRVEALAVLDRDVYAGGAFTRATNSGGASVSANYIAKWNGSSWSALGSGMNDTVETLAVSGSDVYAAGWFTRATNSGGSSVSVNRIAKWNGSTWSALGSGMNSPVDALTVSGSSLYAGGDFTIVGGKVSAYLARAVLGNAPGYNQLTGTPLSEGAMQFSYLGYPATNYALDHAFDLSPPIGWVGQQTSTMTVSGVLSFTNTPVPGTNNFWRVRSVP